MERPDLTFNYYYPFYTQSCTGEMKSFYRVETLIHLSDKKGFLLSISYKRKKPYEIEIKELDDPHILYDKRTKGELLHYTSFSKEVEKVYRLLSGALKALSSCKSYKKTLIFTAYFKYNSDIELTLEHKKISVVFDNFDYVIEDGQKKKNESDASYISEAMEKARIFISAIEGKTTYVEIDNETFNKELDYYWEYFMEYFKSPKYIKKSEYLPK